MKYNPDGAAEWARSVASASRSSCFYDIAADTEGNVYAVGYQYGDSTFTYGTGVSAAGSAVNSYNNAVIVKYSTDGTAQWARTVSTGSNHSEFTGIAIDSGDNIYVVGHQNGTGTYTYGTGVTAAGIDSSRNLIIVKYNSGGTAQWGKNRFNQVVTVQNSSVRRQILRVMFMLPGINTAAVLSPTQQELLLPDPSPYNNAVIVNYNTSGTAQWAGTVVSGSGYSVFNGVATDSSNNVCAAGYQYGTGTYTYGAGGYGCRRLFMAEFRYCVSTIQARNGTVGKKRFFSW